MAESAISQSSTATLTDPELIIKTNHLIYFRLAFALVSLVVAALLAWVAGSEEHPLIAILYADGFVLVYTTIALLVVKTIQPSQTGVLKILNGILLGFDIIALSVLVHLNKGVESDLYFLYLLPTLLASHTFGKKGIFATAFGASLAYVVVIVAENHSFLPYLLDRQNTATLVEAYSQRLWTHILTRSVMLIGVSFVWALFCEHMSQVAQQGAARLLLELNANNKLVADMTAQAAREQMMNSIASAIRSSLDIDQVLSTTAAQLITAFHASRCAIITPADQIGSPPQIWEAASEANKDKPLPAFSKQFCETMLDNFAQSSDADDGSIRRPDLFDDPQGEPIFESVRAELAALDVQSIIVQSVTYAGDSKGVLVVAECGRKHNWLESEIELTKAVSAQVSIAIEHARLVAQLSRKNRDLLSKNLNLDAKNLELRTMQSTLIHQEKMASLGRMVAGIAHELNNPVNFVHGNLPYLREYFEDLKKIIGALDAVPEEYRQVADKLKHDVRYEFLITDLDHIIADLAEGADRIRQIIKNLRSFSRLDEAELKEASILDGLESTIKILSQYYGRDKIQPVCKYDELPLVTCYPGKLNQVWMNLLSNAAQAVAEVENPKVEIEAKLDGKWVLVAISDNGAGIKPQDQSKIFEPFYTTKPIGQGTGLGLSICHSIIDRHGGKIWFETSAGQGTTFKVQIPLKAEPEMPEDSRETAVSRD